MGFPHKEKLEFWAQESKVARPRRGGGEQRAGHNRDEKEMDWGWGGGDSVKKRKKVEARREGTTEKLSLSGKETPMPGLQYGWEWGGKFEYLGRLGLDRQRNG